MSLDLLRGDPASASAGWVTVVSGGVRAPGHEQAPRLRRLLVQLVLAGAVAALVVSVAGSLAVRRVAESQSVHDVAQLTDVVAQSAVQPALTDDIEGPQSARALVELDRLVRGSVLSDSLLRLKLWSADGTVVYSDERRLIGMRFGLDEEAQDAFSDPQTVAAVSDLSRPENLFERGQGKLLEVYRPIWTPSGQEYLLEAYYRYDVVGDRSSQLWRAFLGITLSSLAILLVLMIPIMAALLARARRAQAEREAVLQRGLDASAEERRRIAAALHDGVVQELAAAAFAAAAVSESAANRGDTAHAAALGQVAATVRAGVGGLRTLLVDIYPPNLQSAGLAAALRDVAVTAAGRSVQVRLEVDEDVAARLDFQQQQAVFRVVGECVRNAVKHSRARDVLIALSAGPMPADGPNSERVELAKGFRLTVTDNGDGFDAAAALRVAHDAGAPHEHLGLRLMSEVAASVGAELAVLSVPGRGTSWLMVAA